MPLLPQVHQLLQQHIGGALHEQVVWFHLGFNVALAVLFIGFTGAGRAGWSTAGCPSPPPRADSTRPRHLDPVALATPSLAISCAAREALHQADVVETMLRGMLPVIRHNDLALAEQLRNMDDTVDELYSAIKFYLTQISREALSERESRRWTDIVSFTINMEQIGDIIERVLQDVEDKKIRKNRSFSDAGMAEICHLHERLLANLRLGMSVFLDGHVRDAKKLLEEKARFRDLEHEYAASHIARLQDNTAQSIETSSLHLDLISDLKRINSHICSIAYPILEAAGVLSQTRIRNSRLAELTPGRLGATAASVCTGGRQHAQGATDLNCEHAPGLRQHQRGLQRERFVEQALAQCRRRHALELRHLAVLVDGHGARLQGGLEDVDVFDHVALAQRPPNGHAAVGTQRVELRQAQPGLLPGFALQGLFDVFVGRHQAAHQRVPQPGVGGLVEGSLLHPVTAFGIAADEVHCMRGDAQRPHRRALDARHRRALRVVHRAAARCASGSRDLARAATAPSAASAASASPSICQPASAARSGKPASRRRSASAGFDRADLGAARAQRPARADRAAARRAAMSARSRSRCSQCRGFGGQTHGLSRACRPASSITVTPSSRALSSLLPASSPATT